MTRIQELVEQARKYARDYVADCKHYGHYMEHNELEVKFEEKFALLIVKECMNAVGNGPMERASIQAIKAAFGVEYYEPIEKGFGVEE